MNWQEVLLLISCLTNLAIFIVYIAGLLKSSRDAHANMHIELNELRKRREERFAKSNNIWIVKK